MDTRIELLIFKRKPMKGSKVQLTNSRSGVVEEVDPDCVRMWCDDTKKYESFLYEVRTKNKKEAVPMNKDKVNVKGVKAVATSIDDLLEKPSTKMTAAPSKKPAPVPAKPAPGKKPEAKKPETKKVVKAVQKTSGGGKGPRYKVGERTMSEIPTTVKYWIEQSKETKNLSIVALSIVARDALAAWEKDNADRIKQFATEAKVAVPKAIPVKM